ncbi:MAG: hypothetical protein NT062_09180, partial [Proteobacteria bacterium]|nr:hypothetical protein [Pseudomonadota bacterium]
MNRSLISTISAVAAFASLAACAGPVDAPSSDTEDTDPTTLGGDGSGATGADFDAPPGEAWRIVDVHYEAQSNGYWCGPFATKMALSGRITPPSETMLANQLGTTTNGTDWIG